MFKTKKVLAVLLSISLLFIGLPAAPAMARDIQVTVNGQTVKFTDQKPFLNQDNRILVPVRAPMELAGCKVDWAEATQTVVVSQNCVVAEFTIGSNQYKLNGESKTMDTKAQIYNGRTCFPIRFVAEAMGMKVDWNDSTQTVIINGTANVNKGATQVNPTIDPKQTGDSTTKAMTDITAEAKARLMAYPYPADKNGKQYPVIRKMVEDKEYGQTIGRDILEIMKEPLNLNQVVKANQRFITDGDLCYSSRNPSGGSRIRGVLQTANQEGKITEQDVEYGFSYGTVFVKPGEPTIPSHWFSEYDTVQLSAPVRVK